MPHLDVALNYTLRLTGQEVNLIGKALAGMDLTEEQREEGRRLNVRLMELKAKTLQKALSDAEHTLDMADRVAAKAGDQEEAEPNE